MVSYKKWYDIGNVDSLKKTRDAVPDRFHLLDKDDESIYIFDDFVIKFSMILKSVKIVLIDCLLLEKLHQSS